MRRIDGYLSRALAAAAMVLAATPAHAAELLIGRVQLEDAQEVDFRLTGQSRAEVVGGEIALGESRFQVTRVSFHKLLGADRVPASEDGSAEFAVFSSSFSEQTGVGTPWVAAQRAVHCDAPYNSFLAVYRVDSADKRQALGPIPYSTLTDQIGSADHSVVYCFMSSPPDRAGGEAPARQ